MSPIFIIALYYTLSFYFCNAIKVTDDEWIPFTPKNFSCIGSNYGPNLIASYCTREKNYEKGIDAQTCLPIEFWMSVCRANPRSANKALAEAMEYEDYDQKLRETPWHETCYMYSSTWPLCVTKEDKHKYCNLWRQLSTKERQAVRTLSRISSS